MRFWRKNSSTARALAAGGKGNDNPGVLPLKANAFGKSYEEWSAAWWQWALSAPK